MFINLISHNRYLDSPEFGKSRRDLGMADTGICAWTKRLVSSKLAKGGIKDIARCFE